jgi:hypothetical protein
MIKQTGLAIGVFLIYMAKAEATTFTVPGNFSSIAAAVLGAPDGATILVSDGTYGAITAANLNKRLYIRSVNGPAQAVITGNGGSRLLRIENAIPGGDPERNVVFDGFTFRDGRGIDGIASPVTIAEAKPVFINCIFENNSATDKGGAVLVYGANAHPVFVDCIFRNNRSDSFGGAALVNGGHPKATFKRCQFISNTTRTPGTSNFSEGGALKFSQGGGYVIECTFISNSTAYAGGAIMVLNDFSQSIEDRVEVTRCIFEGNFAQPWPGASPPNPPPTEGGAIMVENKVLVVVDGCLFTNNTAATGAGIMVYRGKLQVNNSVFDRNTANGTQLFGGGGAIGMNSFDAVPPDHPQAVVWLNHVMIRNNRAPVGGAIFAQGDPYWDLNNNHRGLLFMNRVVMENNVATTANNSYGNGGGIFLNLMQASGTNVYILNNTAENYGGGMVMVQNSSFRLEDSYVVGNQASVDAEFHAPNHPAPIYAGTVRAYNGGSGTASLSHLAAIPERSYDNRAYLTYLNLPYGSPSLTPGLGGLPNRGGYAAGTVLAAPMLSNTTYRLNSQFSQQSVTVSRSFRSTDSAAYGGVTPAIPSVLEAERYDLGGFQIAYHDRTIPNEGGAFRTGERVDVGAAGSASGGFFVGWLAAGEWMDYSFFAPVAGSYNIKVRVAAPAAGGQFTLAVDGVAIGGVQSVPNTGGWAAWQDVTLANIPVSAGYHVLRFVSVDGDYNFDRIAFESPLPTLGVTPSGRLLRSVKVGTNAIGHTVQVRNIGGATLSFTATSSVPWLSVSPGSGTSAGEARSLSLQYNVSSLPTGTYNAVVTVQSPEAVNAPLSIPVRLRVVADRYVVNDFDGDGSSDLGVYFAPGGNWYIFRSSLGFLQDQFGFLGTVPVAGDFDGDGKSDLSVYFPPGGNWYIFGSQRGFFVDQFGFSGTIPVSGDYDGDGKSDLALYHPPSGTWFIFRTTLGYYSEVFGAPDTLPVSGDFDGDGVSDLAYYFPAGGNWTIKGSTRGIFTETFGFAGTVPISGDFDGDGKSDLAVYFAPGGNWYIFGSQRGFFEDQFGFAGTIPVPGDFDGDGKSDLAVYYPPGGNWYIFRSSEGFLTDQFGFDGTVPLGSTVLP